MRGGNSQYFLTSEPRTLIPDPDPYGTTCMRDKVVYNRQAVYLILNYAGKLHQDLYDTMCCRVAVSQMYSKAI
jgi:hypothetical protein